MKRAMSGSVTIQKQTQYKRRGFSPVVAIVLFGLLGLVLLPFIGLTGIAFSGSLGAWPHLLEHVLPGSLRQTFYLLLLVALGTSLLGAGTAWLTSVFEFPLRRLFSWALVLPLAVPTYIAAYTQLEFFDYSGPIQTFVREVGGFKNFRDYWFPDLRSLWGAALVFSLVLYPYVYITTRLTFSRQGASALDACRTLGAKPSRMFWQVGLPMVRPALAAGVAIALMETMNDIGAVEILGIRTLTYAVFDTWLNRDDLVGAVQLAIVLLLIIAFLVWLERKARGARNYSVSSRERPTARLRLYGTRKWLAVFACMTPIVLGLGVPIYVLGAYTLRRLEDGISSAVLHAAYNSVLVATMSAVIATMIAYGIIQYARLSRNKRIATTGRIASLGYAVPGTVLAIGLLIPLASFDNWVDSILRSSFGVSSGLLFTGSIAIVIYAYVLRFLAISYGTVESGFGRVSPHIDLVARSLGRTSMQVATHVHTPIMKNVLAAAFLLVFVDSMKELSATLLLRQINFETLSTFIYDQASQAALEDGAAAALIIVSIGLVPVYLISRAPQE
jgi:iron(III) transport system permease protein